MACASMSLWMPAAVQASNRRMFFACRSSGKKNLTVLRHLVHFGALLGAWGKVGQYLAEFRIAKRRTVGTITARHQRYVGAQVGAGPWLQLLVQIGGGVCKGAKNNDLAVCFAPVVGCVLGCYFVFDDGFLFQELCDFAPGPVVSDT